MMARLPSPGRAERPGLGPLSLDRLTGPAEQITSAASGEEGGMADEPDRGVARVGEILEQARDALTVKRVFGAPYEKDGSLIVPVAVVRGGGGGGTGSDEGGGSGLGGGFGMTARPVGVFRIQGDSVSWHAVADTTRVIVLGQLVGIVALLVLRSIVKLITARRYSASPGPRA